jgi:hypothetical protein
MLLLLRQLSQEGALGLPLRGLLDFEPTRGRPCNEVQSGCAIYNQFHR